MPMERELLLYLLKKPENEFFRIEDVQREAKIPSEVLEDILKINVSFGIIEFDGKNLILNSKKRLRAALRAIELGADIERVCKLLTWKEFEDLSEFAFEANHFKVKKHFHFIWSNRRWKIDLLALKEPIVASVDCKQWRKKWRGAPSQKAAERQIERTKALAEASPSLCEKIGIKGWREACFIPITLSLLGGTNKFHKSSPIVSILQLQDFLNELPARIGELAHFRRVYVAL